MTSPNSFSAAGHSITYFSMMSATNICGARVAPLHLHLHPHVGLRRSSRWPPSHLLPTAEPQSFLSKSLPALSTLPSSSRGSRDQDLASALLSHHDSGAHPANFLEFPCSRVSNQPTPVAAAVSLPSGTHAAQDGFLADFGRSHCANSGIFYASSAVACLALAPWSLLDFDCLSWENHALRRASVTESGFDG
ncbi:uncharacterized protein BDV17DRAFT_15769 [Aspergillus undulatus]|uniref:uncharacterized protein n=1 Tax=Aspergillus undulatus TaxID=1810928 RepID=UPI003CCD2FC2